MSKIPIIATALLVGAFMITPVIFSVAESGDRTPIDIQREKIEDLEAKVKELEARNQEATQKLAKIDALIKQYQDDLANTTQQITAQYEKQLEQLKAEHAAKEKAYESKLIANSDLSESSLKATLQNEEDSQKLLTELGTSGEEVKGFSGRIAKLEDRITGPNRLLTLSSFVNLDQKSVIKPGEEWISPNNPSTFPRGPYRIALWVNVAGHPDHDQSTTIEVYYYTPATPEWRKDSSIGNWVITGRDWDDHYIDVNISKISSFLNEPTWSFVWRNFKVKNIGNKTLEIFAYGIIQEPIRYIQR